MFKNGSDYDVDLRGRHNNHARNKGHKHSDEARAKMSAAKKGNIPWNKGVKGVPNPKTALGLRKYHDSNPDRCEIIEKQRAGIQAWYKTVTPQQKAEKAEKIQRSRFTKNFDRYVRARDCVDANTIAEARRQTGMDPSVLKKIKLRTHPFFKYFPDQI